MSVYPKFSLQYPQHRKTQQSYHNKSFGISSVVYLSYYIKCHSSHLYCFIYVFHSEESNNYLDGRNKQRLGKDQTSWKSVTIWIDREF